MYVVGGLAWILATDWLVTALGDGRTLQSLKGTLFVAGTGALLYAVLRRRERTIDATHETLDDARRRFESIVRASPVPIVALDVDGRVETWNPAAEETFGWSAEEVRGEQIPIVPADRREEFRTLFGRVTDGESIAGREIQRETASGAERTLSLSAAPVFDAEGDVDGVMAVFRDVTERRAREQSLAAYRDLVDHLPVGVFRTAPRDRDEFVEVNPALVEMFDADSAADLLATPLSELFADPEERPRFHDALAEQGTATAELRFETLSGEVFWARTTAIRRVDDEGNVYVEGTIQDVSERKERDRQLAVLDRMLRHNLRNKMCVILGRAADVERWATGDTAAAAREIQAQGDALLNLASDQREIVELVADPPDVVDCDLAAVVRRQAGRARKRHPEATVDVTCPDAVRVRAIDAIGRAVGELLDNAIVHADDAAPRVEIRVEVGERVRCAVVDEGPGIPDPEVAVLAGEHDVGPLYHGSGMGLWLVRWIVRASDGTLRFTDNEPRGSVVTMTFDRA
ncbi:MAG: PAS domain S-box protein [Halobacteriaceae archaeon]